MRICFLAAISLCIIQNAVAQEVLFPLSCNPVIKEYISKIPASLRTVNPQRQTALALPFRDDFSGRSIYPDVQLWTDSDAFVNQTFCDNPISLGVATLDGIDKEGNPHDSNSTSATPVICDYLTSQPIDLSASSPADSVYFSFYYQPQGFGDEPENGDSLVLQFFSTDGVDSVWNNVWVADGSANSPFAGVRIKIDSTPYFWAGFQFRFYNYANPNGNRDHWNIDYVTLDRNESYNEPLNEITLVNPITSYLEEFSAMPYHHYKHLMSQGINPVRDTIYETIRAYEYPGGSTTANLTSFVSDRFGTPVSSLVDNVLNLPEYSDTIMIIDLPPFLFDTTIADFTDFHIQHQMSTLQNSGIAQNDTSYGTQHFYNYYAYDDGSAESATGVHVAYTKYAYKFDVKKADSLLGIQIYFNPWGRNVHFDLFSLCLWSNLVVGTNTDNLVAQTIDQLPANNDSINGFVDYYFDQPLWIQPGTHYIGIIQSSVNEIGIGVDHNTDSHDKMFLNFNNQWYQSTITGSWMMRPLFGKQLTISVSENETSERVLVYPSPASHLIYIQSEFSGKVTIQNLLGEQIYSGSVAANEISKISATDFANGIYTVRIEDRNSSKVAVQKLVVSH